MKIMSIVYIVPVQFAWTSYWFFTSQFSWK